MSVITRLQCIWEARTPTLRKRQKIQPPARGGSFSDSIKFISRGQFDGQSSVLLAAGRCRVLRSFAHQRDWQLDCNGCCRGGSLFSLAVFGRAKLLVKAERVMVPHLHSSHRIAACLSIKPGIGFCRNTYTRATQPSTLGGTTGKQINF